MLVNTDLALFCFAIFCIPIQETIKYEMRAVILFIGQMSRSFINISSNIHSDWFSTKKTFNDNLQDSYHHKLYQVTSNIRYNDQSGVRSINGDDKRLPTGQVEINGYYMIKVALCSHLTNILYRLQQTFRTFTFSQCFKSSYGH